MRLGILAAVWAVSALAEPAAAQVSVGVGRGGVSVNTPYFSFQYGRGYPGFYGYRPYSLYAVPSYGNGYGLGSVYPPIYYGRLPSYYAVPYARTLPESYATYPRYRPIGPTSAGASAIVRVIVPKPDADVWIGDVLMKQQGTERVYSSPPLERGQSYFYTIRASWMEDGKELIREKTVPLVPGKEALVTFDDAPIP
jgi:uncharacterized protein (TIGR03000 family)